jgi:hypothetical protein
MAAPLLLRAFLAAFALTACATASHAQICRWKDATGVHYADKPPPGVKCERNVTPSGASKAPAPVADAAAPDPAGGAGGEAGAEPKGGAPAAQPRNTKDLEMEFRKRRLEKQEAEKRAEAERQEKALKKENCESSKARVAGLMNGGRVTRYTAAGEPYYLSDAQIGEELAAAQRNVDLSCR